MYEIVCLFFRELVDERAKAVEAHKKPLILLDGACTGARRLTEPDFAIESTTT